jgi:hypothetical protein
MSKKIAVLSDFHCGHKVGLTPKGYLPEEPADERARWVNANKAYYNWYSQNIRKNGPYDIIFINGDLVDGTGKKSGGTEQITTDMEEQCDMAVKIIREIPKSKNCSIVITRGTPYHTGDSEDWENIIAERVDAAIGEHEWVDVEGVVFDLKHHPAGSSGIPHGRHSGVARDRLWNLIWAEKELQPKGDVFIRSHVHYHNFAGGPDWLAMTTPALQGFGSRYGARRCTGIVDFGFVTFTVNKGTYTWQPIIAKLEEQKAPMIKL